MAIAMALLTAGAFTTSFAWVASGLVLQGIGYGLGTPSISSAASNAAPEDDIGIVSAVSRLMGSMGSSFGVTLLTLIYGGHDVASAFAAAFATGGVLAVGAFSVAGVAGGMAKPATTQARSPARRRYGSRPASRNSSDASPRAAIDRHTSSFGSIATRS
jgi:MFS family permease